MTTRAKLPEASDYFPAEKAVKFIPSGCTILDCALGGGWPIGRVVNIVGDKSTGKTLLAIEAVANFIRKYPKGRAIYCETEAAFDEEYADQLGIPAGGRLEMIQDCYTVEDLFNRVQESAKSASTNSDAPTLFIVDSLDALSDESEMESDFGAASYGAKKAQRLSKFFRQINKILSDKNFLLIFISQIRDKIGVTFGKKYTRSGGHAMDFYCSQIVWLSHLKILKKTAKGAERAVGVRIKAKIEKNKLASPHREVEFNILFSYGVDDHKANLEFIGEPKGDYPPDVLAKQAAELWQEIENRFKPTERKYK